MNQVVVPNAFADVILLVGVDDNTHLTPVGVDVGDTDDVSVYNSLYELKYEARVLSAISATDMVNFFPFTHRVETYPPSNRRETFEQQVEAMNKQKEKMMSEFNLGSKKSFQHADTSPKKTTRSMSVNPKLMLARSMSTFRRPKLGNKTVTLVPDLPISDEVINAIPTFCFPDGLKVHEQKPESTTHFFVLTDISGRRSYTTCLTFYLRFFVVKDDQGTVYINPDIDEKEKINEDGMICYIPQCCVIISKFPYYIKMKECLSSMFFYIEKDPGEVITFLKEYANIITHTPVPPAGNLAVRFRLYNLNVTLLPPTHPDKPVIDLELHLTFLCFSAEEFLKILTCILMEERIVFLSTNYALLTLIMESVMNLVLPFKWRFTYSTILPSSALGYLESPGTFMYGVHSRHKADVEQVEGLVLVDIDEGTVHIPEPYHDSTTRMENGLPVTSSVPSMPATAVSAFKAKWSHLKLQFDLIDTIRPYSYDMEATRQYRSKKIMAQNKYIADTCLELMVNLFRDVVYKLRFDLKRFDREKFLKEHSVDEEFYKNVFKTDMFKVFLEERMKEKSDYWSDLEMKTRGFGNSRSTSTFHNRSRRYTLSQITPTDKEIMTLCLQDITNLKIYVKNSILQITKAMEVSDDYDERTSLNYLRALFYFADQDYLSSMEDFISLSNINLRILPLKVITELYSKFSEEDKSKFMTMPGHGVILDCIEDSKGPEGERQRIKMGPVEIPITDINFDQFEEIVLLKQLCTDYSTIKILYEALTQEKGTSAELKQFIFELFVCCWDDNQEKCRQVTLEDNVLSDEEQILKISTLIKTDFGLGRMGLTDKRLFFLSDVSNNYKEIIKLREIERIEQSENSSIFSSIFTSSRVPTLKIHQKGKGLSPFTAYLKEDRNWWYMVIREMWAGKVVAESLKDVMMVQHAIQNTLLIDAIIASGQDGTASHSANSEATAEKLSYFYNLYKEGKHKLPHDTSDMLQRKIDVNLGEKESKTVQSLLYTGGDAHNIVPRLWCGLSDGRIKVFSAITWTLESEVVVIQKQYVACLTAVDESHVWAGSSGVYILDAHTVTCTKTLLDHTDLVVDIVLYDKNRFVYTASLNGTIMKWNLQKLTRDKEIIKLTDMKNLRSFKIHKDRLICASWSKILVCDLEGTILTTLEAKEKGMLVDVDGFSIAGDGEVWAGTRREGTIHIWNISNGNLKQTLTIDNCKGISSMQEVDGKIWIGTRDGTIYIYTVDDRKKWKELKAHEDIVRVLCDVRDRYMISGGGSKDGRVCIWNATAQNVELLSDE